MTCQGRVEWPRSSRAQRSRVDDTIIGLAAGHNGHAHPPACVPPVPMMMILLLFLQKQNLNTAEPGALHTAEPGALHTSCLARSLALVSVASPMVLPGIPDGFPETAHSVHTQRSRVEETDCIPAADEGSRVHPPTPTAPAPRAPASGPQPPVLYGVLLRNR